MKRILSLILINSVLFGILDAEAQPLNQKKQFSRQDSLRGSLNSERDWWDVDSYAVHITPDFLNRSIAGSNEIKFRVLKSNKAMQIDLQQPMEIESIEWNKQKLKYTREGNAFHVQFPQMLKANTQHAIRILFKGNPMIAARPPWSGGWIFNKDKLGRPWMSAACQGLGASVWYPCKDYQGDEPDKGASLQMTVADTLVAVANGKLISKKSNQPGMMTYTWSVLNPINSYNLVPYIGKYVHWEESFSGEKGQLECSYWVLDYELEKAQKQFKQVPLMLKSFEYWFGPYPFYEDGYKLVQSPHLGMEHQSAIAYGNEFRNGYRGRDLSGSGWGTKWDFIIVHESGHEWFANNITSKDIADMWIHESFTNYSETLFITSEFGKEAGNDYVIGTRKLIKNDIPIIGVYGVNKEGSGDMYYKGGNLVHLIRQIINDDEKFRQVLRGLNKTFYHQTVTTKQVEDFISKESKIDFSKVFDQYLRTIKIPVLEYKVLPQGISYRFVNCNNDFSMPVKFQAGKEIWLNVNTQWQDSPKYPDWFDSKLVAVDRNFYVTPKKVE